MRLNQVLAVERTTVRQVHERGTEINHAIQKTDLFNGQVRTYQPLADDAPREERLPPESKVVQTNVVDLVTEIQRIYVGLFDATLTRDTANTVAFADVVDDDDNVIVPHCPVPFLLWLEKQLFGIHGFLERLPVLDPSVTWHRDESTGEWVSDDVMTNRTRKQPQTHTAAPATDKHPAQVVTYDVDVVVGTWTTRRLSKAIPMAVRRRLITECEKIQRYVVSARERANMTEVEDLAGRAAPLFDILFAPLSEA